MLESLLPSDYQSLFRYLPDAKLLTNTLVSLAPLYTYGMACLGIYRKRSSAGFSIDICATMLMASILRILYFAISPYEMSLLRQSCVMVFIQCILLKVSLRYRHSSYNPELLAELPNLSQQLASVPKVAASSFQYDDFEFYSKLTDSFVQHIIVYFNQAVRFFDVHYKRPFLFWQWVEHYHYWKFLRYFTFIFAVLTVVLRQNGGFSSFIGVLGLFIEALLPLPQILMLQRLQTVENFRSILLVSWLGGDCMKLSYLFFGTDNISFIFIFAGLFQMGLDFVILGQYVYFYRLDARKARSLELPMHDIGA